MRGEDIPRPEDSPAIERLFDALIGEFKGSPVDLSVLFRHVLRQEDVPLWVPSTSAMPSAEDWSKSGVVAESRNGGLFISARPWAPDWLPDVPRNGVDGAAARAVERRRSEAIRPDPYLANLGFETYKSNGQRRALRAALSAPRGSTLVVSLPTGEGKSLVFHALARLGFGEHRGVTLVVTPTVALAFDHEQSSLQLGFDDMPMAYRAESPEQNRTLRDRIATGQQALCFASPEAVCTALRAPLGQAAQRGLIRAIVVDEAHLIGSWGISFRPDFQMLAGLRHQLMRLAESRQFRTVLLSATLTDDSIAVLRTLFPGEQFRIVSASRLRPEVEYWVAKTTSQSIRDSRVLEAIHHLPRPLILYTTTREDASRWYGTLKELGCSRIGKVTGDTPDSERGRVIKDWKDGHIDLVVGTSAFGLGIDNSNVRSVVHACQPESLDRFYQEVGRGGRDGCASISLLLPSYKDERIAKRLSQQQLITPEKAEHRWRAMFTHKDHRVEAGIHVVPVDRRPGVDSREIDMVGPKNTLWNIRTLVLMAASGGVHLLDVPHQLVRQASDAADAEDEAGAEDPEDDAPSQVKLELPDEMHLHKTFWNGRIKDFRMSQKQAADRSFKRMTAFIESGQCAADIIGPIYDVPGDPALHVPKVTVGRACGGCPACRRKGKSRREGETPLTSHPWSPISPLSPLDRLLLPNGQLLVFYSQRPSGSLARRREENALRQVGASGVRNLILLDNTFSAEDFADIEGVPLFVARELGLNDLPPGPTVIVAGEGKDLEPYLFEQRTAGHERIWLIHESAPHPSRPGISLLDVPPNARVMSLGEFVAELER